MNILQFLRILVARRWIIILPAIACFVVAAAVAFALPKRYPASARVIMDIVKPDPVTGESVAGRDSRPYVRTEIELIKDMRVAGLVVDRLGLANDPATLASYEATGRSASDGGVRAWVGQQIIDNTSAGLVSGSNILEIRYQASNPEVARSIVTALREAYVESSLRYRIDSAASTGGWFSEQAQKAQQSLIAAERAMAEYMGENDIVLVGDVDSETARLQHLAASVQAARGSQTAIEANVNARLANDPVVDQLRIQLAAVNEELALAAAKLGPNHPQYQAMEARKRATERQISQAQSNSATGVDAATGASRASLAELEKALAEQEKLVLARKPILDELVRLNRDVNLKRTIYERAMSRTEDLKMQADITQTGLVILGDPVASTTPSYPKIPLIVTMASLVGLAFGVFAALVIEFVARRVRGAEDLAYAAGAPVMVTVSVTQPSRFKEAVRRLLGGRRHQSDSSQLQAI